MKKKLLSLALLSIFVFFYQPPPQEFASTQQARDWVIENTVVVGGDATYGCYSYAVDTSNKALKDGYLLYPMFIDSQTVNGKHVTDAKTPHYGGMFNIEGKTFYIETDPRTERFGEVTRISQDLYKYGY